MRMRTRLAGPNVFPGDDKTETLSFVKPPLLHTVPTGSFVEPHPIPIPGLQGPPQASPVRSAGTPGVTNPAAAVVPSPTDGFVASPSSAPAFGVHSPTLRVLAPPFPPIAPPLVVRSSPGSHTCVIVQQAQSPGGPNVVYIHQGQTGASYPVGMPFPAVPAVPAVPQVQPGGADSLHLRSAVPAQRQWASKKWEGGESGPGTQGTGPAVAPRAPPGPAWSDPSGRLPPGSVNGGSSAAVPWVPPVYGPALEHSAPCFKPAPSTQGGGGWGGAPPTNVPQVPHCGWGTHRSMLEPGAHGVCGPSGGGDRLPGPRHQVPLSPQAPAAGNTARGPSPTQAPVHPSLQAYPSGSYRGATFQAQRSHAVPQDLAASPVPAPPRGFSMGHSPRAHSPTRFPPTFGPSPRGPAHGGYASNLTPTHASPRPGCSPRTSPDARCGPPACPRSYLRQRSPAPLPRKAAPVGTSQGAGAGTPARDRVPQGPSGPAGAKLAAAALLEGLGSVKRERTDDVDASGGLIRAWRPQAGGLGGEAGAGGPLGTRPAAESHRLRVRLRSPASSPDSLPPLGQPREKVAHVPLSLGPLLALSCSSINFLVHAVLLQERQGQVVPRAFEGPARVPLCFVVC